VCSLSSAVPGSLTTRGPGGDMTFIILIISREKKYPEGYGNTREFENLVLVGNTQ